MAQRVVSGPKNVWLWSKNVLWEKVLKHANFGCQEKHSSYVKVALYQRIFSKKLDYRQNYCLTDIFTVQLAESWNLKKKNHLSDLLILQICISLLLAVKHSSYINKGCLISEGISILVLSLKNVPYHILATTFRLTS